MQCVTRPRITELNPHLLCVLCGGYYIEATAIIECLHSFCRSCIVRYLETHKYCPICDVLVHKTQPLQNIRPDKILQSIVYKLVPNLYQKEMCNRRNFYVPIHPNLRPSDSELRGEITESSTFFSFSDTIQLSLEYMNYLDDQNYFFVASSNKRYFRCRADVSIKNLQKLIAFKYASSTNHEVRFFYNGIQLPEYLTLLDIAYISSWKRRDFIRLLYQILVVQKTTTSLEKENISTTETVLQFDDLKTNSVLAPTIDVTKNNDHMNEIPKTVKDVQGVVLNSEAKIMSQNETHEDAPQSTTNNAIELHNGSISVITVASNHITVSSTSLSSVSIATVSSVEKSAINKTSCVVEIPTTSESVTLTSITFSEAVTGEVEADNNRRSSHDSDKSLKMEILTENCIEPSILNRSFDPVVQNSENPLPSSVNDKLSTDSPVPIKISKLSNNGQIESSKSAISCIFPKTTTVTLNTVKALNNNTTSGNSAITLTYSMANKYNSLKTSASPAIRKSELTPKINSRPIFRRCEPQSGIDANNKIVKSFTRPWSTPSVLVSSTPLATSAPSIQIKEKPKVMKIINKRNTPRYLGNPASGIRPMYQIPTVPELTTKTSKSDDVKKPIKNVSVMKIDPQTLSPIIASCTSSSTSVSTSVSKKPYSYLPRTSDLYTNVNLFSNSSTAHTTSSSLTGKSASPYLALSSSTSNTLHPLMYEMYGNKPRTLEYMKAMSDFCNNPIFFHPSLPAPINTLYSSLHSPAKYEKPHSKVSTKSPPPAVQRIPPTNNNTKISVSEHSTDKKTMLSGKHDAISNGQMKSKGKKLSEMSNFSINNLIPLEAMKYMSHSCGADGVNQICDQLPPDPSIKTSTNEVKTNESPTAEKDEDKKDN